MILGHHASTRFFTSTTGTNILRFPFHYGLELSNHRHQFVSYEHNCASGLANLLHIKVARDLVGNCRQSECLDGAPVCPMDSCRRRVQSLPGPAAQVSSSLPHGTAMKGLSSAGEVSNSQSWNEWFGPILKGPLSNLLQATCTANSCALLELSPCSLANHTRPTTTSQYRSAGFKGWHIALRECARLSSASVSVPKLL